MNGVLLAFLGGQLARASGRVILAESRRDLEARPISVPVARRYAREVLATWGLDDLVEDALAVTSELVTNGVEATLRHRAPFAARDLWIGLCRTDARVIVQVWDRTPEPPRPADQGREAIRGRGLPLVGSIAETWGCRWPQGGGKIVWALLRKSRP
ncbi:ATP-binding protein [Nonomuraea rhizosphaerae]|uniref:ATP-binding protein n=1 Tax=Nonomuraea rhizosphaerae TaxID=2665663 RepID=UPI001C5F7879|nr:ATP-binding protein [Nonomuraea rhizosphaerae]